MTVVNLVATTALIALAAGCGGPAPVAAPPERPRGALPGASPPSGTAPPTTSAAPPTLTLDEFVARTVSKAGDAVFVRGLGTEEEVACEGFSFCERHCLDRACTEATYRLACGQGPVYPIPTSAEQSRPVACSPDGARCSVDREGVHNPAYPAPRYRDTFFFDASGIVIGFERGPAAEPSRLDPAALHELAETTCAYRRALEAKSLEPVERLSVRLSAAADLEGEQPRDFEEHLCGRGVPDLVRRIIDHVVGDGGFDGCRLGEGSLFTCWVYGTEAWTLYHAENVSTAREPRFALFAIATEGRALDEDAQARETTATAEFLERARAGSAARVGRALPISAAERVGVRNCP